ncbi:MAG: hypothetical protein ACK55I_35755, partial [bacterium]
MQLARLHREGDIPAAIRALHRLRLKRLGIDQGDLLEQVGDQLLMGRPCLAADVTQQIQAVGVGRRLEG